MSAFNPWDSMLKMVQDWRADSASGALTALAKNQSLISSTQGTWHHILVAMGTYTFVHAYIHTHKYFSIIKNVFEDGC